MSPSLSMALLCQSDRDLSTVHLLKLLLFIQSLVQPNLLTGEVSFDIKVSSKNGITSVFTLKFDHNWSRLSALAISPWLSSISSSHP